MTESTRGWLAIGFFGLLVLVIVLTAPLEAVITIGVIFAVAFGLLWSIIQLLEYGAPWRRR